MIGTFKIDQTQTFGSMHLMSVEPKTEFKSDQQQTDKTSGDPKWTAKVAITYQVFGRNESEILNVNVTSRNDPGAGVAPFTPVELVGLEVNVGPKSDRENKMVPGITQWYRADEIRSITAPTSAKSAKSEA